jgi:hypothetical protein
MRVALLPGTENVFRFPIELRQRPSMTLLRELRPDPRVVLMQAEASGFELPPHDLRERTDLATAEYIGGDARIAGQFLDDLLQPVMARAVEAARRAGDAASAARVAQEAADASHASGYLKERAFEIGAQCVRLQLEAHILSEEAEGVARAVQYARRGEPWVPRDQEAEMDILLAAETARRSRG